MKPSALALLSLLLLSACGREERDEPAMMPKDASAVTTGNSQSKAALMLPMPKDKAQLERLVAMGYTPHDDHLHAPGVNACPKMSEDPVR